MFQQEQKGMYSPPAGLSRESTRNGMSSWGGTPDTSKLISNFKVGLLNTY